MILKATRYMQVKNLKSDKLILTFFLFLTRRLPLLLLGTTSLFAQDVLYIKDTLFFSATTDTLFIIGNSEIADGGGYVEQQAGNWIFDGNIRRQNTDAVYTAGKNTGAKMIYAGRGRDTLDLPGDTTGILVMKAQSSKDTLVLLSRFHSYSGFNYQRGIVYAPETAPIVFLDFSNTGVKTHQLDSSFVSGYAVWKIDNTFSVSDTLIYPLGDSLSRPVKIIPQTAFTGVGTETRIKVGFLKDTVPGQVPKYYVPNWGYWRASYETGGLTTNDSLKVALSIRVADTLPPFSSYRSIYSYDEHGTYDYIDTRYDVTPNDPIIYARTRDWFYPPGFIGGTPATDSIFLAIVKYNCFVGQFNVPTPFCEGDTVGVSISIDSAGVENISASTFSWSISTDGGTTFGVPVDSNGVLYANLGELYGTSGAVNPYQIKLIISDTYCKDSMTMDMQVDTAIKVRFTAFLEGPYDKVAQRMKANSNYFNLLKSIYEDNGNLSPWKLDSMFPGYFVPVAVTDSAVDVVRLLVQDAAGNVVDSAWGWVMQDGRINDFKTGKYWVTNFGCGTDAPAPGNYRVSVLHKNHIPVSSLNSAVNLSKTFGTGGVLQYSFASESNVLGIADYNYYLDSAVVPYRVLLPAGNAMDTPGLDEYEVNAFDFYQFNLMNGTTSLPTYLREDFNLDGFVNASDFPLVSTNNDRLMRAAYSLIPIMFFRNQGGIPPIKAKEPLSNNKTENSNDD